MKHNNKYRIYEINQDLIDFLRGDGKYVNRPKEKTDKQVYSHYGETRKVSDKYIGIIVEFEQKMYFAPITHDGSKTWEQRDDTCDLQRVYDSQNNYAGSLLLCKALPLTNNLAKYLSYQDIQKESGDSYAYLCQTELNYLNSLEVHPRLQIKMQKCIYGYQTSCMHLRVNYQLTAKNVLEYNEFQRQIKINNN